jgi:hypothetical protein
MTRATPLATEVTLSTDEDAAPMIDCPLYTYFAVKTHPLFARFVR